MYNIVQMCICTYTCVHTYKHTYIHTYIHAMHTLYYLYVHTYICYVMYYCTDVKDAVQLHNNYNVSYIVIGVGETVKFTASSIYNRKSVTFM